MQKGTTYKRIVLYLAKEGHWPVKAELYVSSGKLAKEATFKMELVDGENLVTSMTLVDRIQRSRKTVIRYLSRTPRSIPDKVFNPMYLVRNSKLDW